MGFNLQLHKVNGKDLTEEVDELPMDKPTFVYLGGLADFVLCAEHPNQISHRAFLRMIPEDADLFVVAENALCPKPDQGNYWFNILAHVDTKSDNVVEDRDSEESKELLESIFGFDANPGQTADEIEAKARNLNLVCYSYGTAFAQQFRTTLLDKLSELGFGNIEINHTMSAVTCINLAPVYEIKDQGIKSFTYINLIMFGDIQAGLYSQTELRDAAIKSGKPCLHMVERMREVCTKSEVVANPNLQGLEPVFLARKMVPRSARNLIIASSVDNLTKGECTITPQPDVGVMTDEELDRKDPFHHILTYVRNGGFRIDRDGVCLPTSGIATIFAQLLEGAAHLTGTELILHLETHLKPLLSELTQMEPDIMI